MYFNKKLYILLVSASLLHFLIIATTIETDISVVDEHNVSLKLLVGNSLNQGWPQESGNVLEDLVIINHSISLTLS
jgi:hypothetical protein